MAPKKTKLALDALARVPDDHYMAPQARLLAGQSELRRDRVRQAEEWLRAALELNPQLVQAHRELIYIYGMQLRRTELGAEFTALSKLSDLTFDNAFHWCLLPAWSGMRGPRAQSPCPRLVQARDQIEPARFRVAASVLPADRSPREHAPAARRNAGRILRILIEIRHFAGLVSFHVFRFLLSNGFWHHGSSSTGRFWLSGRRRLGQALPHG